MFFGLSRKLRGLNRSNRKRSSRKRKRAHISNSNKKNVKNQNIRFKIEEIDETPTTRPTTIKTVRTDSLTPIVFSESINQSQTQSRKRVQSRTPTPYPRRETDTSGRDTYAGTNQHHSTRQLNTSGDIILFFMNMLTTVKLYHWKTMSYATHKATDELYEELNKYVDEFVEVMIGHKGGVRATLPRTNVKIYDCASKEEFSRKIEEYKEVLVGFTSRFGGKKNSDLLNIRDEILGALNKSLYVMSFK
jgi:DNA-binding ferritin-like protein